MTCFVIIGYGKKTSYANGKARVLDLDETYTLLIKPVFDALGIPCYRAIDKNLSGSIDKVMLQEIKNADIALVDISTLNANVMWELGVRHSLKPRHTIMICEKEQMGSIPFDVNHFVVQQYVHSEEGIPFKEVERFKAVLTSVVQKIINDQSQETDSPVFTFLKTDEEQPTKLRSSSSSVNEDSFATIMEKSEIAKNNKEYEKALNLLETARSFAQHSMTLKQNLGFIISRQALCTYKLKKPTEQESLYAAKQFLDELTPNQSQDLEVIGLSGAIYKRLNEVSGDVLYLDTAIKFYEKGFQLKQDYYNGINTAFMLYKKASLLRKEGKEWEDIKLKADYIRNSVLAITLKLETEPDFLKSKDAIWVLLTTAEAYNYKNDSIKLKEYEDKATALAAENNDQFALSSYQEQKDKIREITNNLK